MKTIETKGKSKQRTLKLPPTYDEVVKELAGAAIQLTDACMMRGWSGQLSARSTQLNGYSIVIKRSGGSADDLTAYCTVDSHGENPNPTDARPSLVTRVHCAIYASCPGVNAVIQCRGLYADAVATVLGELPLSLETYWALMAVPVIIDINTIRRDTIDKFIDEMAIAVSNALAKPGEDTNAVCIPFYGMWVTGATIVETIGRALAIEDLAKSAYLRSIMASTLDLPAPTFPPWFANMLKQLRRPCAGRESCQ